MANYLNTLKRQTICQFIQRYIAAHGWAPTFTEIGEAVGIGSKGHVHYHLTRLEREGYLVRRHHTMRAIRLTEAGKALASIEAKQEWREPVTPLSGYVSTL
jgi:repressor LexA